MSVESSDPVVVSGGRRALSAGPLGSGVPVDRRPAIWPWLVMPLVTLSMFFALDKLHKTHGRDTPAFSAGAQSGPGSGPGDFSGH